MRYLSSLFLTALVMIGLLFTAQSTSSSSSSTGTWQIDGIFPPTGPVDGLTKITIYSSYLQGKNYSSFRFPKCQFGAGGPHTDADWVHCASLGDHFVKHTEKFASFQEEYDVFDNIDEAVFLGHPTGNNTCLVCVSPSISKPGPIMLRVSVAGDFTDVQEIDFRYYVQPILSYSVPFIGRQEGGTYVQVHGSGFQDFRDLLKCGFGTKHVEAKFVDDTLVVCFAPRSDLIDTPIPLTITLNIQQATPTYSMYYYYSFPEVTQLVPNRGPYSGGTRVNIYGKSMHPFKTQSLDVSNTSFVRFGKDYVMPLEIYNQTIAYVSTPAPYKECTLPVEITFNDQEWTSNGILFTFYAPPYVFQLIPNVGPLEGGTNCTVYGANFENTSNITCDFGGRYSTGHFIDGNRIWCLAPRGEKAQYVEFRLAIEEDRWSGNNLKYLYYEQPVIFDISPTCGPTYGYTQIAITGQNFIYTAPHKVYCIFGEDIWMDATVMDDKLLYCDSPSVLDRFGVNVNNTVSLPVRVTFNLVDMVNTNRIFTYYIQPKQLLVTPHFGPIEGGTQVTTIVSNLSFYCNLTMRFSTYEVRASYAGGNNATVLSPAVSCPNDVEVDVSLNGQQYTRSNPDLWDTRFSYYKVPTINGFAPERFPNTGNSPITIFGEDFLHSRNDSTGVGKKEDVSYLCRFRDADGNILDTRRAFYVDDNSIKCMTPAVDQPLKSVKIEISPNEGQNWHSATPTGKSFDYYQSPIVTAIDPNFGPLKQRNATVIVSGKNFGCPDVDCAKLACRFSLSDGFVNTGSKMINSTAVYCNIPAVSKPGVSSVSVTFDGNEYTTQQVQYTFFDAFILSIDPSLISVRGNSNVTLNGYGFANTGTLKARLGTEENPLTCYGKTPCVISATFIDSTHLRIAIPPQTDLKTKNGTAVGFEAFEIEVNIFGNDFTDNNVSAQYYEEPTIKFNATNATNDPVSIHSNSPETIKMPIDLKIPPNVNPQDYLGKINTTCRFTISGHAYYIPGSIITYPYPKPNETPKDYSVACPAPPMNESGTGGVSVSINGGDFVGNIPISMKPELKLLDIAPRCAPANGSKYVQIDTEGFDDTDIGKLYFLWDTTCTAPLTNDQMYASNRFQVSAPASPNNATTQGGFAYVLFAKKVQYQSPNGTVVDNVHNYLNSREEFYYYKEPTIKRAEPHSGWYTGGTMIEIEGSDFFTLPDYLCIPRCRFGTKEVIAEYVSSVKIRCRTPLYDIPNAKVKMEFSLNGFDWRYTGTEFAFIVPPKILTIAPTSGPSVGGTIITITGVGFMDLSDHPNEFVCIFESVELGRRLKTPIFYKNASTIMCTAPGGWGSGTMATIGLSYNGIDTIDTGSRFKFYQIDRVYPLAGPASGGGYITIQGSGFSNTTGISCLIDGVSSPAENVNWTHIQCPLLKSKFGSNYSGVVNLFYSLNGIDFLQVFDGFTYYKQPNITLVTPRIFPKTGATLQIQGTDLKNDLANLNVTCKIGNTIGRGQLLKGSNLMNCQFWELDFDPATQTTSQDVQISLNGYHFTESNNRSLITIFNILQITPSSGVIKGETTITIEGYGFALGVVPRCRFGIAGQNSITYGTTIDSKTIHCKSPSANIPNNGQLPYIEPFAIAYAEDAFDPFTTTDHTFTYYRNPRILKIDPAEGSIDQTIKVTIYSEKGFNFASAIVGAQMVLDKTAIHQTTITCKFGNLGETKADIIANDKITCTTPTLSSKVSSSYAKQTPVTIAMNGQDHTDTEVYFAFKGMLAPRGSGLVWIVAIIVGALVLIGMIIYMSNYLARRGHSQGPLSLLGQGELIHPVQPM